MKWSWISATAAHCARSIRAGLGLLIPRNLGELLEPGVGYRRDVDGLRAVAILSVVFFHAGFTGFNGGFVGVDIFFVISGYLITAIIVRSLEAERFSIAWFYERRIRRIIPALVVMVAVTAIGATVFLFPKDLIEFGHSAFAAAFFASNFFFASRTGYFAQAQETMPLLHTWSLGVEEQFYIVWPLVLWTCFRLGFSRKIGVLVFVLAAASLGYAEWAVRREDPDVVFFLPQARAWELMLGAMLALGMVPAITSRWVREALAAVGVVLLAFGITRFSAHTPFPGLWATIPVVGAALVLHTGRQGDTAISKLLGLWPCVFIGLISYSVYLWHWPIFAFTKVYLGHKQTEGLTLCLILATIIIATASWWLIERPFRHTAATARISPQLLFVGGVGSLAVIGCVGLTLVFAHGLPNRIGHGARRFYFDGKRKIELAHNPAADILVWGDSHAQAFARAALIVGRQYGLTVGASGTENCPPLIGAHRVGGGYSRDCDAINRALLRRLQQGPRPRVAILLARWSLYQGGTSHDGPVFEIDDQEQTLDPETSTRVLARALGRTVDALQALGISVVLVGQAPEFPEHPNSCFVRRIWHKEPNAGDCLTMPREQSDRRLSTSKAILTQLADTHEAVWYVGLDSILCGGQTCRAAEDHRPLYYDDNHLSLFGSYVVGRKLAGRRSSLRHLFAELTPAVSPIDSAPAKP
jgi:peptidoglycan/LPS O-acetylase OafA/YrhL